MSISNQIKTPKGSIDTSNALNSVATHNKFIENLIHDTNLNTITWNIVNYTKELTNKYDRVSILIPQKYNTPPYEKISKYISSLKFTLKACSGVHSVNPRGELSVLLTNLAKELTLSAIYSTEEKNKNSDHVTIKESTKITLSQRNLIKEIKKNSIIYHYFNNTYMDWASAIPLWSNNNKISGILLIEGQDQPKNLSTQLLQAQTLLAPTGHILSNALSWNKNKVLLFSKKLTGIRNEIIKKSFLIKSFLFISLMILIVNFPIPYSIKGKAILSSQNQIIIPAQTHSRVSKIYAQQGDSIKKGDLLAKLETQNLLLKLASAKKLYKKNISLLNKFIQDKNESEIFSTNFHIQSNLSAIQKIYLDLERSNIKAPIDGIITEPLFSQSLKGKSTNPGTPLFKIKNTDSWKIQVNLREQDINILQEELIKNKNLTVSLKLNSTPTSNYLLKIKNINQIILGSMPNSDKFYYTLSLDLENKNPNHNHFKNGNKGLVSINVGFRPLHYILFREFNEYMQLQNI